MSLNDDISFAGFTGPKGTLAHFAFPAHVTSGTELLSCHLDPDDPPPTITLNLVSDRLGFFLSTNFALLSSQICANFDEFDQDWGKKNESGLDAENRIHFETDLTCFMYTEEHVDVHPARSRFFLLQPATILLSVRNLHFVEKL